MGAIKFDRIPWSAPSSAITLDKPAMPALAEQLVVRLIGQAEEAGARRREHEASVVLVAHDAERRLTHVERPEEVRAEHPHQLLVSHLHERLVAQDAGVVHHDVETPELAERRVSTISPRHRRGRRPTRTRGPPVLPRTVISSTTASAALVGERPVPSTAPPRSFTTTDAPRRPNSTACAQAEAVPGAGHDDHPAVERDVAGSVSHRSRSQRSSGAPLPPRHFTTHKCRFNGEIRPGRRTLLIW